MRFVDFSCWPHLPRPRESHHYWRCKFFILFDIINFICTCHLHCIINNHAFSKLLSIGVNYVFCKSAESTLYYTANTQILYFYSNFKVFSVVEFLIANNGLEFFFIFLINKTTKQNADYIHFERRDWIRRRK